MILTNGGATVLFLPVPPEKHAEVKMCTIIQEKNSLKTNFSKDVQNTNSSSDCPIHHLVGRKPCLQIGWVLLLSSNFAFWVAMIFVWDVKDSTGEQVRFPTDQ